MISVDLNWDPATYDAPRHRLVPDFDAFYQTVAMLVQMSQSDSPAVLDLGGGTGLLSEAILAAVPSASVILMDQSLEMLAIAKQRLAAFQVTTLVANLEDELPAGKFDAIVSALAIHHLPNEEKSRLFARATQSLADGGVLINADQVAGPTSWHDSVYRIMHENQSRALGSDDAEWSAAVQRMQIDQYASVHWHLNCFERSGLVNNDIFFKRFGFTVMAGWKP